MAANGRKRHIMSAHTLLRQPHAVLDLPSRNWKAMKIERLLGLAARPQPMRMLEIGTGSGGIAHYFGTHPQLQCDVTAVDVHDNRQVHDGYTFQLVRGVELPFGQDEFDVVITNHVIEHVGDAAAQDQHLTEIYRVMKQDGVGYLAVPNRWMLTEPHYHLMFLSWWPHAWRTPYLRLMRKGDFYDVEPLQIKRLERMLAKAGFRYRNLCMEAWRTTLEIERPNELGTRILQVMPNTVFAPLRRIIPTFIYRIERARV